jgi:transcriptional regulator with XRE-family HTH domain
MSSSADLVTVLKAELRRAGITYARLAQELGLAESSVKRIFARGDLSLARVDQVLAVLKMEFADLARQVAQASPERKELTVAQERAVVANPTLLLVAISALSQWTLEQIVETYTLTRAQALAALLALDRLGILELRPNNSYRLKLDKTIRWRPNGPIMQFFRQRAMGEYFGGGFDGEGEMLMLVHGQLSPAQAALFNERLQRLGNDFAQQHLADFKLPPSERRPYTLLVATRSWLFQPFSSMLRVRS